MCLKVERRTEEGNESTREVVKILKKNKTEELEVVEKRGKVVQRVVELSGENFEGKEIRGEVVQRVYENITKREFSNARGKEINWKVERRAEIEFSERGREMVYRLVKI